MSSREAAERVVAVAGNPDASRDEIIVWAKQFFAGVREATPAEIGAGFQSLAGGIEHAKRIPFIS